MSPTPPPADTAVPPGDPAGDARTRALAEEPAPAVTDPALRAVPPGGRLENAWMAVLLALDLLSIPFHVVAFLLTRRRHREAFRRTLEDAVA